MWPKIHILTLLFHVAAFAAKRPVGDAATIQDNGYSDVVIAISPYASDPSNPFEGFNFLESLKEDIIEASNVLYASTKRRAYFKDVVVLLPNSTWPIADVLIEEATPDGRHYFGNSDVRIVESLDEQPLTSQSGACGIPGNYIQVPIHFFNHITDRRTRAKILVREWSKYRYGVFDEVAIEGHDSAHLFVHPQGYKAVTSCNNTIIGGSLQNDVFTPDQEQSALSSLMAFPAIGSVEEFCDETNHDPLPPNRQNVLCGRSILEVIEQSPDFTNGQNPPMDGDRPPEPVFTLKTSSTMPVVHAVFDLAEGMNIRTRSPLLNLLVEYKLPNNTYMMVSSYSGTDTGVGSYLKQESPLLNVVSGNAELYNTIFNLANTGDQARDTGAAVRDAITTQSQYNENGGSILYLVSRFSNGGSIIKELDIIERLSSNNIQLVAAELADNSPEKKFNLKHLCDTIDGHHFGAFDTATWNQAAVDANEKLVSLAKSSVRSDKKSVFVQEHKGMSNGLVVNGDFIMSVDRGTDTMVLVQSSRSGAVTVRLTNSNDEELSFQTSNRTNWNMNVPLFLESFPVIDQSTGKWQYSISFSSSIPDEGSDVKLEVISGRKPNWTIYEPAVWISSPVIDLNSSPSATIFAQIDTPAGKLGGLVVQAVVTKQTTGAVAIMIDLKEDVFSGSRVYSGIFVPPSEGFYSLMAHFRTLTTECSNCAPADFSERIDGDFIKVTGTPSEWPPARIVDLALTDGPEDDQNLLVHLTWTAPSASPSTPNVPVLSYDVKYSSALRNLLYDFESCPDVNIIDFGNALPGAQIATQCSVSNGAGQSFYFAVRAVSGSGIKGEASNIAWNVIHAGSNEATTAGTGESSPSDPPTTTSESTEESSLSNGDLQTTDDGIRTTDLSSEASSAEHTDLSTVSPSTNLPETESSSEGYSFTGSTRKPVTETAGFILGLSLGIALLLSVVMIGVCCHRIHRESDRHSKEMDDASSLPTIIPRAYLTRSLNPWADELRSSTYANSSSDNSVTNLPYQRFR